MYINRKSMKKIGQESQVISSFLKRGPPFTTVTTRFDLPRSKARTHRNKHVKEKKKTSLFSSCRIAGARVYIQ